MTVRLTTTVLAVALGVGPLVAQSTAPQPFPGSTPAPATAGPAPVRSAPATPPAAPAPAQNTPRLPGTMPAGVLLYPNAEFLTSFDAGSGQHYYLYGSNTAFADVVAYYRTTLRTGSREIYKAPATHQFDLGKFQDDAMAYPPSVVVKDYTWNNSPGYLHVTGTTEKRFKTIIQIVPPGPAR